MAAALGHRWGQIIGDLLESAMLELLNAVAAQHDLYLDYKHARPARGGSPVVRWQDKYENEHQLDYVMERGGTEGAVGTPAAFIESAWRRYTKHSKNKAQEIEGALVPLADTYGHLRPFIGAIIAGDFTANSLRQLRSRGFCVLHISIGSVVAAFSTADIDASYGELTAEAEFAEKIENFERLSESQRQAIKTALFERTPDIDEFLVALEGALSRQVETIAVTLLHGEAVSLASSAAALGYFRGYSEATGTALGVHSYEIHVSFTNGDSIRVVFQEKNDAERFLASL